MNTALTLFAAVILSLPQNQVVYGTVTQVGSRGDVVEIRVDVDHKAMTVELAPASFLEQYNFSVKAGDTISLHLRREGGRILATEIGKVNRRLTLRDEEGRPLW